MYCRGKYIFAIKEKKFHAELAKSIRKVRKKFAYSASFFAFFAWSLYSKKL